ncbi:DNA polymerase IV [Nitzschia inconspicua]|uniref:DNA polymerase eta n=1 Tax=Nitzschia inconspicua TaxID=303405 RepID=A0A9K3PE88_9STRA|nr:DNA polymerase IV [Nitzschia inconspicua]
MPSPLTTHRRRRPLERPSPPHHRIVLLFDLDAFYAQTERVRLGLGLDASVALLQWNSVLAVTYPAREYGIKRGDSWEAVASKSKHKCIAIHLPILPMRENDSRIVNNDDSKVAEDEEEQDENDSEEKDISLETSDTDREAFDKEFRLSKEEREQIFKNENGVQRYHHQGKASLERYRLASRVIFTNVLDSLKRRVGKGFILEKASIDEFYLDITEYCYGDVEGKCDDDDDVDMTKTKVVGENGKELGATELDMDDADDLEISLRRACQLSAWIRNDVWKNLGFTMSAGISTNKMMSKLTASFGKPNGQAVLNPKNFGKLMSETKVRKVRNFGGKLGKRVLDVLHTNSASEQSLEDFSSNATMGDLAQVPLTVLQQAFSSETAHFVFQACQGIDNEMVKETSGALVKSITAFKSFTANKNHGEVLGWLKLLANEIVERVAQDAARNHRYPKTCTLNYTYYTTADGRRPYDRMGARTQRQSRSYRLVFPADRKSIVAQSESLVEQAMTKLAPILKEHPLRGVGLAASNFESRGQPPEGNASIESFFSVETAINVSQGGFRHKSNNNSSALPNSKRQRINSAPFEVQVPNTNEAKETPSNFPDTTPHVIDKDLELAKKLQASFDRENYVFSKLNSRREGGATKSMKKAKTKQIDSFFKKR